MKLMTTSYSHDIKRGEIFYVFPSPNKEEIGHEIIVPITGRPALIISCDDGNFTSNMCVVVYLTRQAKADLPTHVHIDKGDCSGSTILCEHPFAVSQERVGEWVRTLPEFLMKEVDKALVIGLAIKITGKQAEKEISAFEVQVEEKDVKIKELGIELEKTQIKLRLLENGKTNEPSITSPIVNQNTSNDIAIIRLQSEVDVYKHLYQDLLIKSLK